LAEGDGERRRGGEGRGGGGPDALGDRGATDLEVVVAVVAGDDGVRSQCQGGRAEGRLAGVVHVHRPADIRGDREGDRSSRHVGGRGDRRHRGGEGDRLAIRRAGWRRGQGGGTVAQADRLRDRVG